MTGTDGEYIAGDTVPIEVTFSSAVAVSGAPRLLLETGTTDRHADYAAGTGTATLRFHYTVQADDAAADLQYKGTAALALNGGRIEAAADSLDAVLTLPALDAAASLAASSDGGGGHGQVAHLLDRRGARRRGRPRRLHRDAGAPRPAARGERGVHGGDAHGRHGDGGRGLHAGGGDARVRCDRDHRDVLGDDAPGH